MNIALIVGIAILISLILVFRAGRKRGRLVFDMASNYEKEGDYEAACYFFAEALSAGHNKQFCRGKILELWKEHGPFEFKRQLEEAKAACRYESCGEGAHSLTVSDIQKIVRTMK
jgi:hypothetical protein